MVYLTLGLVIFLGVHSVRIVAEGWRTRTQNRIGVGAFKGIYSVLSLLGFALIVWGFGVARETPWMVWMPPMGMRHATYFLTWIAFVLLAAAYVPGNAIKARFHHPMVMGVKFWALAHLLTTGSFAHMVLFGSFLAWAVLDFMAARRRDQVTGAQYADGTVLGTGVTVVVGTLAWAVFAFWLHGFWIGIKPIG